MPVANKLKVLLLLAGDVVALYVALFLVLVIKYGSEFYSQFVEAHVLPFTIVFAIWIGVFYVSGLYDLRRLRNNLEFLKILGLALAINAIIAALFFYTVRAFGITPKTNLLLVILIFAVMETYWRRFWNRIVTFSEAPNRVLFVGDGGTAEEIISTIEQNPQLGYGIMARLPEEAAYSSPDALRNAVLKEKANLVVVPRHFKHEGRLASILYELFKEDIAVSDLINFYELVMRKVPLSELEESWFLENLIERQKFYDSLKRAWELIAALAIGILLLPFQILIGAAVKLTSPGPAIYKQARVGKNGREFMLYKFRTMRTDAEKNGPQWAKANDSRVTAFGKFLRITHLDELPQIVNLIKGDLSFVGPRPERPEFVKKLKERVPYYEVRLLVKPGVSGWAQINYPKDESIEDVFQKMQYDIYYIKHRSPILDLAIILKTARLLFGNPRAK